MFSSSVLAEESHGLEWDALAAFERGEYQLAVELFERAYTLAPNPDLLFNLARSHGRLDSCDAARTHLRRYLEEVSAPPSEYHEGVRELEVDCPTVHASSPTTHPYDGTGSTGSDLQPGPALQPPLKPPPQLSLKPPPQLSSRGNQTTKATPGNVEERQASTPSARDPWAYGFVALGGASAVASIAFGIGAINTKQELEGLARELSVNPSRTWDDAAGPLVARLERQSDLALSFGVTALILESVGVLLLLAPWKNEGAAASQGLSLESVKVRGNTQGFWCGYEGVL